MKKVKMIKAAKIILPVILLLCLCTGCGAVQVNERMYVQMMGVSGSEDECVLCVQVCSTKSPPEEAPVYEYLEGTGKSFRKAAADIEQKSGRELFFGHCTLVILDKNHLYNEEDIKMIMGERVSPGCRVCCSDNPGYALSRKKDSGGNDGGNIIGADVISGEMKQYEKRGQLSEVTLKDVCILADKGGAAVIPAFYGDNFGSGAVSANRDILYLSPEETAVWGLLKGESGGEFPVLGGTVRADKVRSSVYLQTGENILNISANLSCTLTETGTSGSLSDYESEAGNDIANALTMLLQKAEAAGLTEALTGVKTEDGTSFNCTAGVKITDRG